MCIHPATSKKNGTVRRDYIACDALLNWDLYFTLFVHMCVCVHKSDAADMQAVNTCSRLHQFRSMHMPLAAKTQTSKAD